jgi:predicted GIY-YIG superfamily endonuclease
MRSVDFRKPTALYRLFNAEGALLYIGISFDPAHRAHSHSGDKPWWNEVADRQEVWFENRRAAEDAERTAIVAESPRYNRAWVPDPNRAPLPPKPGPKPPMDPALRAELVAAADALRAAPVLMREVIFKAATRGWNANQITEAIGMVYSPDYVRAMIREAREAGVIPPKGSIPEKRD